VTLVQAIDAPAILIVDDNHSFVDLVADSVARSYPQARIGRATSGEEAIGVLQEESWDVVLLDYRLPDIDGLEVLAEIRKHLIDVGVVMITGEGDEKLAADLFRMGAWDYLVKGSINARAIETSIGQALTRRVLARQHGLAERGVDSSKLEERSRALDIAYDKLREKKEQLRLLSDSLEATIQERTAELKATTAFLNEVLASTTDYFIIACNSKGVVLSFNKGAETLFGVDAEDVVGRRHFRTLFSELAEVGAAEELLAQVADGLSPQLELLALVRGREGFLSKVSFSRLEEAGWSGSDDGKDGLVIIGSDVTHERELEAENQEYIRQIEETNQHLRFSNEKILEATRLKDQFLANVSHELRTPLNAIIGYADLLDGGIYGELVGKQNDAVRSISTRAADLLALINDILDLARIESGMADLRIGRFTVANLLEEVCETGQVLALEKQVDVTWRDHGCAEVMLHTDRQKLQQILLNLVNNGVKFTSAGSVLIESRELSEQTIEFTVTDTGIGIPDDELESVFDEFRQVDGSSTREYGGSGLGLTISRKLARLLGGDVSVVSEVGVGSTFRVFVAREAVPSSSLLAAGRFHIEESGT